MANNTHVDSFYTTLPSKRMGSGVLLISSEDKIIVVKPSYKSSWEIPGGIVEKGESPLVGAIREVREELGLTISRDQLKLASVDYIAAGGDKSEALMFLFAMNISKLNLSKISVNEQELTDYSLILPTECQFYLGAMLGHRVQRALSAFHNGGVAYFEDRYDH